MAVRPGHIQPRAAQRGQQHLPTGHVEADRRLLQHDIGRVDPEVALHPAQLVDHVAMLDLHSLGTPGGARRVKHIRKFRVVYAHVERTRVAGNEIQGVDLHRAVVRRGALKVLARRDQRRRCTVADHEVEPVARVTGVERNVCGTGLEHRQ